MRGKNNNNNNKHSTGFEISVDFGPQIQKAVENSSLNKRIKCLLNFNLSPQMLIACNNSQSVSGISKVSVTQAELTHNTKTYQKENLEDQE